MSREAKLSCCRSVTSYSKCVYYIKAQCGSVVEHCVSSGLDSQGTHILMKMHGLNAIVSRFG